MNCKRNWVVLLAATSLVFNSVGGPLRGQDQAPPADAAPSAPSPGLNNAATDQNGDGQPDIRWPMQATTPDGTVTVFEPQLESLNGNQLTARAAVSVQKQGQADPVFGAIWMTSRVSTDRVSRIVSVQDVKITQSHFPADGQSLDAHALEAAMTQMLQTQPVNLSLDSLLEMVQSVQQEEANAQDLETAAPKVVFREHPTVLVQYDGAPKVVSPENAHGGPQRVVNTPFFVALDPQSKSYFLRGAGQWYESGDPLGPWKETANPPQSVAQMADREQYKDPSTTQPSMTATAAQKHANIEIITATEPTEVVWTDGPAQMTPIANTNLLYVSNTDADWFVFVDSQEHFLLLSGRWYSTKNRNDSWTYVEPDKLPAQFAKIPPNSDKGDVLAQIAGTAQANDAIADTYVPQTATIDRKNYDQPSIEYDGDPRFENCDGANCTYAVNSAVPVLCFSGDYYCCSNAVWYRSHSPHGGRWDICTEVPGEFYRIRPSCPVYAVRYVNVYGFTDDVIYVGYTPGYVGCYPFRHTVVYGTGYRYRPWWGQRYIPRPFTYGFAARYNSYVGHWGFSFALATGRSSEWISREAHADGRRADWFGYGGYRPVVLHGEVHRDLFRNNYVTRVREERGERRDVARAEAIRDEHRDAYVRNVYERRNDVHWETRAREADARRVEDAEKRAVDARRPEQREAIARQSDVRNNVFVDRDGAVYRRGDNGGWEKRDGNQWRAADLRGDQRTPAPVLGNGQKNDPPRANPNDARDARGGGNRPGDPQPASPNAPASPQARPGDPQPNPRNAPQGKPGDPQPATPNAPASPQARPGDPQPNPRNAPQGKPGDPQPARDPKADLDRAAHARDAAADRLKGYEKPAAPSPSTPRTEPRPAPAPRPAAPSGGGNTGGGRSGGGNSGGSSGAGGGGKHGK